MKKQETEYDKLLKNLRAFNRRHRTSYNVTRNNLAKAMNQYRLIIDYQREKERVARIINQVRAEGFEVKDIKTPPRITQKNIDELRNITEKADLNKQAKKKWGTIYVNEKYSILYTDFHNVTRGVYKRAEFTGKAGKYVIKTEVVPSPKPNKRIRDFTDNEKARAEVVSLPIGDYFAIKADDDEPGGIDYYTFLRDGDGGSASELLYQEMNGKTDMIYVNLDTSNDEYTLSVKNNMNESSKGVKLKQLWGKASTYLTNCSDDLFEIFDTWTVYKPEDKCFYYIVNGMEYNANDPTTLQFLN